MRREYPAMLSFGQRTTERAPSIQGRNIHRRAVMSLQYVEYTSVGFPPPGFFAKGGGNQGPGTRSSSQGAGKPSKKATKKARKKAATKKKK